LATVGDPRALLAVGQTILRQITNRHQQKNLHPPDKTENEGIQRIPFRTRGMGWPHPSLDGEVDLANGEIMTSTVKPIS